MIVTIKRQDDPKSAPYFQNFNYDGSIDVTVSSVLEYLNYNDDLTDADGKPARRIRWECGCMQKMCGGCAILVNKRPVLACGTFLRDIKGGRLLLEPLSKFPVISDLMVDRSIIQENLKKAEVYVREYSGGNPEDYEHSYLAAKCLKCGLCLEACPNYVNGENFFGAEFANASYLTTSMSKDAKPLKAEYAKHFAKGCSKSLACRSVCPVKIPTLSSIAKLNR